MTSILTTSDAIKNAAETRGYLAAILPEYNSPILKLFADDAFSSKAQTVTVETQ